MNQTKSNLKKLIKKKRTTNQDKSEKKSFALSIKNRLIFSFLIILLLPTAILGYFSFQKSNQELTKQIVENSKQSVEFIDNELDTLIQTSFEDLDYLSKTLTDDMVEGFESPAIREVIDPIKAVKKEYDYVQYVTGDGQLLNSPQQEFSADFDVTERAWYQDALANSGTALVNKPIISQDGKVIVVPSKSAEDGIGVVSIVLSLSNLAAQVNDIVIGQNGYVMIIDEEGKYLTHPTEEIGTESTEPFVSEILNQQSGNLSFKSNGTSEMAIFTTNERTGWKIVGIIDKDEIAEHSEGIFITMIVIIIASLIVGMLVVFGIIRSIHIPLSRLMKATKKVADGDLRENVIVSSSDELGQLSKSVNQMTENLRNLIGQVQQNSDAVLSTSEELSVSAEQTQETADQISHSVQEISSGTELQVSHAKEFQKATTEISSKMTHAAGNVDQVTELSNSTNEKAANGNEVVAKTVKQMDVIQHTVHNTSEVVKTLGEKTGEISNIVTLITDIAGQTNLLALNAAIEAARAGSEGKGFAVVADEVRKLAEQSGAAAGKIKSIIEEVQSEAVNAVQSIEKGNTVVNEGIEMIHLTGQTFNDITKSIEQMASEVIEVSEIVKQVNISSENMEKMADGVADTAQLSADNTQTVAASAEEQSAAMEEVSASAETLSKMAQELKNVIGKFKY
ncbi:methyl-accepting chemotaxis protein [Gracilibacillus xinjiangensis]|uniref:Methyl-accepting chemotaxis protein n=1 Tax=Gracilibacillus xinjiangensis TaxID=1193282 RepID=A0ABV8WSF0_9BACI